MGSGSGQGRLCGSRTPPPSGAAGTARYPAVVPRASPRARVPGLTLTGPVGTPGRGLWKRSRKLGSGGPSQCKFAGETWVVWGAVPREAGTEETRLLARGESGVGSGSRDEVLPCPLPLSPASCEGPGCAHLQSLGLNPWPASPKRDLKARLCLPGNPTCRSSSPAVPENHSPSLPGSEVSVR